MKNLFIYSLILVAGCAGNHCISVGGAYKGVDGNVEYCFDIAESEKAGEPAFIKRNENETMNYLLEETLINKILDKVKDKIGISKMQVKDKKDTHPVRQLKKLLEIK